MTGLRLGLPLTIDGIFRADRYIDSKKQLLSRLADRGFPQATLEGSGEVDLAKLTVTP